MKDPIQNVTPVDARGTFPEHLFGLTAADLPPAIAGWMRGDCKKLLPLIPSFFFDLVITDPPHGINYQTNADGKKGGGRRRYKPNEEIGDAKCVRACILSITKVADVEYTV